ncbi:hypothetical protein SSX86_007177 [Deinandra increscens subsp. villosa]|uniref:CLAVATA3/ESR (CLE)-related protein 9 n=1 Tax=Deinandra increscens subsp. villosa TaxID=3103831 RepID=A0AAP0H6A5_9ASTR
MNNFPPSPPRRKILSVVLLLHLLITAAASTNSPATSLRHPRRHHDQHCTTITFQSQRLHPRRPPLPPLPPQLFQPPSPEEIDPRYGVAKRLVPSGPNPLHN